eukprot:scaffold69932_cov52-Attheya_sp.AAC.5
MLMLAVCACFSRSNFREELLCAVDLLERPLAPTELRRRCLFSFFECDESSCEATVPTSALCTLPATLCTLPLDRRALMLASSFSRPKRRLSAFSGDTSFELVMVKHYARPK